MRRKCLELLSEPDLKKIAGEMFRKSDVDGSGQLDFDEVHKCLEQLHEDMDPCLAAYTGEFYMVPQWVTFSLAKLRIYPSQIGTRWSLC